LQAGSQGDKETCWVLRCVQAAGPQEELRPLSLVGSGGERARIMLALKSMLVLRDAQPTTTETEAEVQAQAEAAGEAQALTPISVFDELDSGVGGQLGGLVGKLLHELCGAQHQVRPQNAEPTSAGPKWQRSRPAEPPCCRQPPATAGLTSQLLYTLFSVRNTRHPAPAII
jgi:hypothetical protein